MLFRKQIVLKQELISNIEKQAYQYFTYFQKYRQKEDSDISNTFFIIQQFWTDFRSSDPCKNLIFDLQTLQNRRRSLENDLLELDQQQEKKIQEREENEAEIGRKSLQLVRVKRMQAFAKGNLERKEKLKGQVEEGEEIAHNIKEFIEEIKRRLQLKSTEIKARETLLYMY